MTTYFTDCKTIEQLKKAFYKIAKELHPDNGGNAEEFKAMQNEYNAVFNRVKNIHATADGDTYEKETAETPEQFADIINKIIHFEGVTIEIIGSWIWTTGNTYEYKDVLKELHFMWSKSKKAWYYNGETDGRKRRGHYSLNKIREKYGSQEVETEKTEKLAA